MLTDVFEITLNSDRSPAAISFCIAPLSEAPPIAFSSQPRQHDFLTLIWIESGEGKNVIDFNQYEVHPHQFHLVQPGQVQYWQVEAPPKGYYLRMTEDFFLLSGNTRLLSEFYWCDNARANPVLNFEQPQASIVQAHLQSMMTEYTEQRRNWIDAIGASLRLILIQAQRQQFQKLQALKTTAGQMLVREFLDLVHQNVLQEHKLTYYAQSLGVTVGHLSETTKAVTGTPAGQFLRQRLIVEAKRRLLYSELPVTQIAKDLNFDDSSYFGRFFKRETSQTPRQFRNKYVAVH